MQTAENASYKFSRYRFFGLQSVSLRVRELGSKVPISATVARPHGSAQAHASSQQCRPASPLPSGIPSLDEAVLLFPDLLGNFDRIVADRAERLRQLFCSVVSHTDTSLRVISRVVYRVAWLNEVPMVETSRYRSNALLEPETALPKIVGLSSLGCDIRHGKRLSPAPKVETGEQVRLTRRIDKKPADAHDCVPSLEI
jgi:hypothetical protein